MGRCRPTRHPRLRIVSPSPLARAALAGAALVVLLLLAVQLRGAAREERAGDAVELVVVGKGGAAMAAQAREDLQGSRPLRPDGNSKALEGLLLVARGKPRQ